MEDIIAIYQVTLQEYNGSRHSYDISDTPIIMRKFKSKEIEDNLCKLFTTKKRTIIHTWYRYRTGNKSERAKYYSINNSN